MLTSLLRNTFGEPKNIYKGGIQYNFNCPNCAKKHNLGIPDGKYNLEINIANTNKNYNTSMVYKCWKCGISGKLKNLLKYHAKKNDYNLFLDIEDDLYIPSEHEENINPELPDEFVSFRDINLKKPKSGKAYDYVLKERCIRENIIKKFNVGVCFDGEYKNKIIIPSYDKDGKLNYFISRSFNEKDYIKHKAPKIPKSNFIGNEYFVNFNSTVYIVEGAFDMLSLPINTVPLYGKYMFSNLIHKLYKFNPNVIIWLDPDAFKENNFKQANLKVPKSTKEIYKSLLYHGITNVKYVHNTKKEDINKLFIDYGENEIFNILKNNIYNNF